MADGLGASGSGVGISRQASASDRLAGVSATDDERVFVMLYPPLRRFAATVADSGTDPDDLVHDALVPVLRNGPLGRLEEPLPYLRRVVLNLAIDRRRGRRRAEAIDPLIITATSGVDTYPSDLSLLDSLPPTDKALLYLVDIEGLPCADAAAVVGLHPPAARARLMRARRRLRRLATEGDDR